MSSKTIFTELDATAQSKEIAQLNVRWGQLYGLTKESTDLAIKYLFFANAGGATVALSFIGGSETVRLLVTPKVALGLFTLGIILSGALLALRLHQFEWLFANWRIDVSSYLKGQLDRTALYERDDQRVSNMKAGANYALGYGGFSCFIIGGALGFISLLCI